MAQRLWSRATRVFKQGVVWHNRESSEKTDGQSKWANYQWNPDATHSSWSGRGVLIFIDLIIWICNRIYLYNYYGLIHDLLIVVCLNYGVWINKDLDFDDAYFVNGSEIRNDTQGCKFGTFYWWLKVRVRKVYEGGINLVRDFSVQLHAINSNPNVKVKVSV